MEILNRFLDDIINGTFTHAACEGGSISGGLVTSLRRPPFKRFNSLRRGNSGRRPNSILAAPDVVPQCHENGEHKSSTEGPASWATSFEKLLECPAGLQTFAEFLKKEFSAENIYFWTACEKYKQLLPGAEKTKEARNIYEQHLRIGAPEAINVDSRARQFTEQTLQEPNDKTFELAQKQIFNLMKFDCYPRFLKSDLYKQCLSGTFNGKEFDSELLIQPPNSTPKLKKSLSNAEDRRRKSLLPWYRKNRSRSKDRGESEYNQRKSEISNNVSNQPGKNCSKDDIHSSKSSLTSLDLATTTTGQDTSKMFCRVILDNDSTTIVQIKESETIQQLVGRLLIKRGLPYQAFVVSTNLHEKFTDINEPSTKLASCEVKVERRSCFRLILPNLTVVSVKSKTTTMLAHVVHQILHKYNYKIDDIIVIYNGDIFDIKNVPVTSVEDYTFQIQLKEKEMKQTAAIPTIKISNAKILPSLDELTNKVYEDILQEKAETVCLKPKSDKGSVKSEDWGSEHSGGKLGLGKFLRRDSGVHERKKKLPSRTKGSSVNGSAEDVNGEHGTSIIKKPLIAKWKPGVKLQKASSESDELYEGLSRAQRARLEDQRGTEINFELPDFLKNKENNQITTNNIRKLRRPEENDVDKTRLYTSDSILHTNQDRAAKNLKLETHSNYENRSIMANENGNVTNNMINNNSHVLNNHNHNTKTNNLKSYLPNKFLGSSDDNASSNQSTPTKNCLDNTVIENISKSNDSLYNKNGDPPPLPPKPKILPIKPPNWGQNGFFKSQKDTSPKKECTKQGLYLEQPSSSFV